MIIEIVGLPGSGKTTLCNHLVALKPHVYQDRYSVVDSWANPSLKLKSLNFLLNLVLMRKLNIFHELHLGRLQDKFSFKNPESHKKSIAFLDSFRNQGFIPNSFWQRWYFNAWAIQSVAINSNLCFLHDEGLAQRLITVMKYVDIEHELIREYFSNVDFVLIFDRHVDECIKQSIKRDRGKRTAKNPEIWIQSYVEPINKLKRLSLCDDKFHLVSPSTIYDSIEAMNNA